jgi:hypothetical protein
MLVANVSTDRLLCCSLDLTKLLQISDPSRWLPSHLIIEYSFSEDRLVVFDLLFWPTVFRWAFVFLLTVGP